MNKKMIALVVAGAMTAPVAMAEVKVSGRVAYDLTDNGTSTSWSDSGQTRLQFDGKSGNAFARLALDERFGRDRNNGGGTDAGRTKRDQYLGYKLANGGAIQAGRMANAGKNIEKDPYIASFLEMRGTTAIAGGAYSSSSFVNDLIQYSQKLGGVSLKIQYDPTDDGAGNDGHTGIALKGKAGPVTWWVANNNGVGDLGDQDNTKVGASMKFGKIKATLNHQINDNAGAEVKRTLLMADMGLADGWSANIAWGESDAAGDPTITRVAVKKKLSKGASVYFGQVDDDAAADAEVGVGMVVKF